MEDEDHYDRLDEALLFLDQNAAGERTHTSPNQLPTKLHLSAVVPTNYNKPPGFWYGFGGSWLGWCLSEGFWRDSPRYIYKVEIPPQANVHRISTEKELSEFDWKYGIIAPCGPGIDWARVMGDFDGISISPYQNSGRYAFRWYYGWDCGSGVHWRGEVKLEPLWDIEQKQIT